MEDKELLKKVYDLTIESRIADEKLNNNFELMNKRVEVLERLSQSMAENLNDMKHLQTIVDTTINNVNQNTNDIKELKKKYYELEQKPMKERASKWSYIVDTIFKTVFGLVLGFILVKIGLTKGV